MTDGSVYFPALLGNDSLKRRLGKDIAENHLSHAYIIEGPRGSGRHTVAMSVAAAIECQARESVGLTDLFGGTNTSTIPCGKCPSCQKILSGKSPDIITVGLEDERVTMGVDSIRKLGIMLRIAESLDRSMSSCVQTINGDVLGDSVIMKTEVEGDCTLEIRDAMDAASEFARSYKKNLEIL